MPDFRVAWEIDVFDAPTPEAAARKALKTQRNPESIATVFRVSEHGSPEGVEIDLTELDEPWCNHDTVAVHNGVCECGEIVSPQPTVGDGDEVFAAQRRWAAQLIEIGFEGGIGYWGRAMRISSGSLDNGIDRIILVEWGAALAALEGGPWIDEAFDGQDPRIAKFTHTLTASATVNAIEKIVAVLAPESHPENWTNDLKRLWSSDPDELTDSIGNVDADLADLVIQYAIFGEVKYG